MELEWKEAIDNVEVNNYFQLYEPSLSLMGYGCHAQSCSIIV